MRQGWNILSTAMYGIITGVIYAYSYVILIMAAVTLSFYCGGTQFRIYTSGTPRETLIMLKR